MPVSLTIQEKFGLGTEIVYQSWALRTLHYSSYIFSNLEMFGILLKQNPCFVCLFFFLYAQSTPFHSSTRQTKLQERKNKSTPEQVLPEKGLDRSNLTIEKYILLWKAKWTLLLSVERFWIYGTYSLSFKPSRKFSKPTPRLKKT